RDQAEALAQHLHPDAWLEALKLETAPVPRQAEPAEADVLDAAGLVADLDADPALRADAAALLDTIRDKLPSGVALDGDLDRWLA
ncbi:hypothetical protein J8J40_31130, partial [Mycobacterium tuberculosis]|nr:hypothetical protein [Mycobacterium tuberculosis]